MGGGRDKKIKLLQRRNVTVWCPLLLHVLSCLRASSSPWIEEHEDPGRKIQLSCHTPQLGVGVHSCFGKQLSWQPFEKGLKLLLLSSRGLPSPALSGENRETKVCERVSEEEIVHERGECY